ncbi:hypothetical protein BJ508DRAFT_380317 [Ascobolus immersus RN42]|uniref:Uncharacterized protein n=1 Tax=Ascobolus immersus RN42 TaxID=1160509 RepID=A0A3N4HM77_ASCIM|nr:hypothetical protein BJ508DRAFT_380317 [Ascobolus immersus RN42]
MTRSVASMKIPAPKNPPGTAIARVSRMVIKRNKPLVRDIKTVDEYMELLKEARLPENGLLAMHIEEYAGYDELLVEACFGPESGVVVRKYSHRVWMQSRLRGGYLGSVEWEDSSEDAYENFEGKLSCEAVIVFDTRHSVNANARQAKRAFIGNAFCGIEKLCFWQFQAVQAKENLHRFS